MKNVSPPVVNEPTTSLLRLAHQSSGEERTYIDLARGLTGKLEGQYMASVATDHVTRAINELVPSVSTEALSEMVEQLVRYRLESRTAGRQDPPTRT